MIYTFIAIFLLTSRSRVNKKIDSRKHWAINNTNGQNFKLRHYDGFVHDREGRFGIGVLLRILELKKLISCLKKKEKIEKTTRNLTSNPELSWIMYRVFQNWNHSILRPNGEKKVIQTWVHKCFLCEIQSR